MQGKLARRLLLDVTLVKRKTKKLSARVDEPPQKRQKKKKNKLAKQKYLVNLALSKANTLIVLGLVLSILTAILVVK